MNGYPQLRQTVDQNPIPSNLTVHRILGRSLYDGADKHIVRCSCPFTNTLANHGYIPRNGLNVSGDVVLAVYDEVFNIDQSFTIGPVTNALKVSTTGINGTFNLFDVNIHNCKYAYPMQFSYSPTFLCNCKGQAPEQDILLTSVISR